MKIFSTFLFLTRGQVHMPTKILHIDSSITIDDSVSRFITDHAVRSLASEDADVEKIYVDLAKDPLPHFNPNLIEKGRGPSATDDLDHLQQFLNADIVVVGVPMYNLTIPSQLKAWIDRVLVPGKTFKYVDGGVVGLVGAKRIIAVLTRGGFYDRSNASLGIEHHENYIRSVFAFVGIDNIEVICAEGLSVSAGHRRAAIDQALHEVSQLKRSSIEELAT